MNDAPTVTRCVTNVRSRAELCAVLAILLCVSGCGAASTARPAPSATASSEQPSDHGGSEGTQAELARGLLSAEEADQLSSFNEVTVEVEKPRGQRLTFPVEIPDPNYLQADYRKGCNAAVQAMQAPQPGVNTVVVADYSEDEGGFSRNKLRRPKARVMAFHTDEEVDIMQLFHLGDGLCVDERSAEPGFYQSLQSGVGEKSSFVYLDFSDGDGNTVREVFGGASKGKNHIFIKIENVSFPDTAPFIEAQLKKFERETSR